MASTELNELRIGSADFELLRAHLLRGDNDEHGALVLAGAFTEGAGTLLTAREVHLLSADDFPPGIRGFRQFAAPALARSANRAAEEGLSLITIHSHPGAHEHNSLSRDDLHAHERVFPHLLDITAAPVVAGLALGEASVAGEIWTRDGRRIPLDRVRVVGPSLSFLRPEPEGDPGPSPERFDRQVRLFGAAGQARLAALHVAVVGAGGGGSILVEQLAHLGVGTITVIDFDIVKPHNLSRIMGATQSDANRGTKKVEVARRLVHTIDANIHVRPVDGDIADADTARLLVDADHLLLATDTATARLVANAVSQTFFIPLIQIGAKVEARRDGSIEQVYTAVRPVLPRQGCLWCAGLIDPVALQREAASPEERANQNYLGDPEIIDPSVTTLNAAAAAGALNVLLMSVIGQASDELAAHRVTLVREGHVLMLAPKRDAECRWCGKSPASRYGRADLSLLPVRAGAGLPERRQPRSMWRGLIGRLLTRMSRKASTARTSRGAR